MIKFLSKLFGLTDVSEDRPLPVRDSDKETRARNADPLLVRTLGVTNTQRDLWGNTASSNPELPTVDNCLQYRTLILTGHKAQSVAITYVVQARCGDSLDPTSSGDPLGSGWLNITSHSTVYNPDGTTGTPGTIAAQTGHFRIVIRLPDGLYFDQYRILMEQASGTQIVHCKLVGVRG